ncbi:MAG TPA: hemerythrin domain-containing protein [Nitrospiraceae bacterium]|nr:hemerythrin domain-containing protein [Nitrospiraceae bacterium]
MDLPFRSRDGSAVELLRKDHEEVKGLFRDFASATEDSEKERIVREAIRALDLHAAIEESVFYPAVREDSPDAKDKLDESLEEHHVVKGLIAELREMSAADERYAAKFRVLAENVKHHIKEEEAKLFARARTGKLDLVDLGKRLEAAKASWRPSAATESGRQRADRRSGRKAAPARATDRRIRKAGKRVSR